MLPPMSAAPSSPTATLFGTPGSESPSPRPTVSLAPESPALVWIVEVINGDTPVVVEIGTPATPSELEKWPLKIATWEIAAGEHSVLVAGPEARTGHFVVLVRDLSGDCDIAAELVFEADSFTAIIDTSADGTVSVETIEGTTLTGPARTDYTSACSG